MTIEGSVTLDDVLSAVQAKRVPLAPELAGYLTLEIADACAGQSVAIDSASVFIGDEGSVAIVRQPKSPQTTGDVEASVREILVRLLDVSGSQTPALGATARRKGGNGLRALVEEVEAALIPVNRAAGRRALARLAREVRRVTQGVGRYAQTARRIPLESRSPAQEEPSTLKQRAVVPRPSVRRVPTPAPLPVSPGLAASAPAATADEPTARRPMTPPPPGLAPGARPQAAVAKAPTPPPPGVGTPAPPVPAVRAATPAPLAVAPAPPPAATAGGTAPTFAEPPEPDPDDEPRRDSLFEHDEVDSLLANFEVAGSFTEKGVSTELKAISGLDPTPPPPADLHALGPPFPGRTPTPPPLTPGGWRADGEGDLLALREASEPRSPPPAPPVPSQPPRDAGLRTPPPPPEEVPSAPWASAPAAAPAAPDTGDTIDRTSSAQDAARKGARWTNVVLALLALAVVGGAAVATWRLAPGFFSGRTAEQIAREKAEQERFANIRQERAQQKCKVSLTVSHVPQDAEVLLRVGQAPADVERMPKGPRLEFVATAEGFAPRRVVIPKDAPWEAGPDGKARYELAVQLDPSKAKPGQQDPWPASEPGSEVGGTGQPGTVHIVGTPRGAELWLLAGVGPQAQIEQLRCDADVELLVAGKVRQRLKVTQKEIEAFPADAAGIRPVKIRAGEGK